jgi:hypothetical protein
MWIEGKLASEQNFAKPALFRNYKSMERKLKYQSFINIFHAQKSTSLNYNNKHAVVSFYLNGLQLCVRVREVSSNSSMHFPHIPRQPHP